MAMRIKIKLPCIVNLQCRGAGTGFALFMRVPEPGPDQIIPHCHIMVFQKPGSLGYKIFLNISICCKYSYPEKNEGKSRCTIETQKNNGGFCCFENAIAGRGTKKQG